MDTRHKQLLIHCVELLNTYDEEMRSMEEHVECYLQANKIHDEADEVFIKEVFAGCICHSAILKSVTEGFFIKDGRNVLRSNENTCLVLTYLALFRLDELGVSHFRKFISILDVSIAYKLLSFITNEKHLLTWMKDEWNKVYEETFVQINLLSPILRWLPELKDLNKLLKNRIDNKLKPKKTAVPATEIKPFSLTKPRARKISVPEKIPKLIKSKPPPKSLYSSPKLLEVIEKQKEENRRSAEENLMAASKLHFACASHENSVKTNQGVQNIISEQDSKTDGNRIKTTPASHFKKEPLPVKMTTAAIMREGLLYQKQESEIIEKLKKLEAGGYDADEFYKWQLEKKQQDLEVKLAAIEKRRLIGKLSHEEAILARTHLIAEKHERVQIMKEETAVMLRNYLDQEFEKEKEMKMLVENIAAGQRNAKDAKKQLMHYKQKIVQEVKEKSRDLMKQGLEEAETKMRSKMELIQQIRALEATSTSHVKMVDLTATAGYGFLGEMSLAELQERLAIIKTQRKEEEDIKRDIIISHKQAKADYLSETMDMIAKFRAEKIKTAACKLEVQKQNKCPDTMVKNETLTELEKRVQERREQRLQEQHKLLLSSQSSKMRKNTLMSQKKTQESRWNDLEKTQERAATAKLPY